jgi:acyl-CoA thioesterase
MTTSSNTSLSTVLQLRADGAHFKATISADWAQGRATFGGLVAALGVRALSHGLGSEHALRSFVVDFAGPVEPGEVSLVVQRLRAGRSLQHAQVQFVQAGEVRAVMAGAFGTTRASQLAVAGAPAPQVPGPEQAPRLPYVEGVMPAFTQHFDYRWTSEYIPFSTAARGCIGGWVRSLDADVVDSAVLAALIDSFPAPILPLMSAPAANSTVTWMVNLVGASESAPADAFWRFEAETDAVGDGYASVHARLWDAAGALRAVSQQLVAEFTRANPR